MLAYPRPLPAACAVPGGGFLPIAFTRGTEITEVAGNGVRCLGVPPVVDLKWTPVPCRGSRRRMVHRNLIAGEWPDPSGSIRNINPSNLDDVVGEYAEGSADQARHAAAAAAQAFPAWS